MANIGKRLLLHSFSLYFNQRYLVSGIFSPLPFSLNAINNKISIREDVPIRTYLTIARYNKDILIIRKSGIPRK